MQVLLVVLLAVDCLGFSWPRQIKETTEEVGSIPKDLGGSNRSFLCKPLIDVKMVCSTTENSGLCASVLVCQLTSQQAWSHISSDALQTYTRKPDCFRKAARAISAQCAELDMEEDARVNGNDRAVPLFQKSKHEF
jgi:hypothetical protein